MTKPYLSIIIPAYNEAERLPKTLIDIDKRLERAPYSYEILVVNDGSKDNTAEVTRNMAKMIRNLKLVDIEDQGGKGGTVRHGMRLAAGQIRLFTDADNATSIDQFDQMMPLFREGCGVVIASRVMKGAKLDPPDLIGFLIPRMAHFMVPRYVRIVDLLPRTPTQKVEKHLIRAQGIAPDTFDREKAGISVKRERIGARAS